MDPPPYTRRTPITMRPGFTYRVSRLFDQKKLTCLVDSPHATISLIRRNIIPEDALVFKTEPKQFIPGFDFGLGPASAMRSCTLDEYCIAPLKIPKTGGVDSVLCKLWIVNEAWADVFMSKSIVGSAGPGKGLNVFKVDRTVWEAIGAFDAHGYVMEKAPL